LLSDKGDRVGRVSSATWSPDFATNVAIGMVRMTHWKAGTALQVMTPEGARRGVVQPGFWA
jgi:dimethylsulfoniopropionate demethylase